MEEGQEGPEDKGFKCGTVVLVSVVHCVCKT